MEGDYTSAPWEVRNGPCVVKGANEIFLADANGEPLTKYQALFDNRAVFDNLRVSFLRLTGGQRLVRLEDALGVLLGIDDDTDAEGTSALLGYLDRCRGHYDPTRDIDCPQWFEAAVLP